MTPGTQPTHKSAIVLTAASHSPDLALHQAVHIFTHACKEQVAAPTDFSGPGKTSARTLTLPVGDPLKWLTHTGHVFFVAGE